MYTFNGWSGFGRRALKAAVYEVFDRRKSLNLLSNLDLRATEMEPIRPLNFDLGRTARKPRRISEADLRPLVRKSDSLGVICSSNCSAACWSCVLTPQTRKSSNG